MVPMTASTVLNPIDVLDDLASPLPLSYKQDPSEAKRRERSCKRFEHSHGIGGMSHRILGLLGVEALFPSVVGIYIEGS